MLWIDCPWCGSRPETEFRYGGEAHIARPDPAVTDDAGWADYLFMRTNSKGVFAERWMHREGCRRWFNALRDTVSNDVLSIYPMGAPRPDAPGDEAEGD